jgi:transcriptional regulator with XRE-family HTH domain
MIRTARRRSGLTQRELAERVGTSAAAVCLYESGQRLPRVDTLERLLAGCGMGLDVELVPAIASIDVAANGRALEAVLDLVSQLPRSSAATLDGPVFGRLAA